MADAPCDLLNAYKLQDYQVEEWLTALWESKENSVFKSLVNEVPIIQRIKALLSSQFTQTTPEEDEEEKKSETSRPTDDAQVQMMLQDEAMTTEQLTELKDLAKTFISETVTDEKSFVTISLFLLTFYMRENCTGPSVYTQYVEDTRAPLIKSGPLPQNDLDCMSNKNLKLQASLLKHFERDGEQIYHKSQFLILLFVLSQLLADEEWVATLGMKTKMFSLLMRARLCYLLDQHLSASVIHLKDESIKLYKRYLSYLEATKDEEFDFGNDTSKIEESMALLHCEYSYCLLHFFKSERAEASLNEARKLTNLNIEFGGKMGKRTRFQQRDIAQLTVDFDTRDISLNIQDVNSTLNDEEGKQESAGVFRPDQETQKHLQSESIYFPDGLPRLVEGSVSRELKETDIVLLQAFTFFQFKELPNDEHREQILRPLSTILSLEQHKKNWLLDTNALLLKARNDYERIKTKESSLVFFQGVLDSYRTQQASFLSKTSHVFAINYPLRWNLQKELAFFYKNMGCLVAAYELLYEVAFIEDAVTCLFAAGRPSQAIDIACQFLNDQDAKAQLLPEFDSTTAAQTTKAREATKQKKRSISQANILCLLGDMRQDADFYRRAWEESDKKCARAMRSLGRWHFYRHEYREAVDCFNSSFEINKLRADDWFTCGCAYMRLEELDKAIFAFGNVVSIEEQNAEAWGNISNCYAVQERYKEALACTEQALKYNRRKWRIWQNCIRFCISTQNLYKGMNCVRELLRNDQFEGLNGHLLLKLTEIYLEKFTEQAGLSREEADRHKAHLFRFFKDWTNCINDYQVWRLYSRLKLQLGEPVADAKECKLQEIRSLQKAGWSNEIEQCKLVERAICELVEMSEQPEGEDPLTSDQRAFVKTTVIAIEQGLQRKCKIEDLVQRMTD